jgi:hypothetical protein
MRPEDPVIEINPEDQSAADAGTREEMGDAE